MTELRLSREPLQKNPSCAYCGKIFNQRGINLQLILDHRIIDFPICQPCSDRIATFEATLDTEQGYVRIRR